MTTFTKSEQQWLVILSVTTSTISFFASLSVLITIIAARFGYVLDGVAINKLSFRLIAALVAADILRSIGNMLRQNVSSNICFFL